jgi:hypothetical protein
MDNIVEAMRTAAECYFADGSVAQAVPPLQALLHIMRHGTWEGVDAAHAEFRALFTRENVLASDWYRARLEAQQHRDVAQWEERARYLEKFLASPNYADVAEQLGIRDRLAAVQAACAAAREPGYIEQLRGTLGLDPALVPSKGD